MLKDTCTSKGNADNSRMIMVGDVLKKISSLSGHGMMDVENFNITMEVIKEKVDQ